MNMKKNIFSVAMAFAAGLFVSCSASAPKVELTGATKVDSLAYAIGVTQTQGLKDYLVGRMDVDTAYMGQFVNGVLEGVDADDKQNAYFAGTQIGQQVVNQIIPGVSREVFGNAEELINRDFFLAGFVAGVTEKNLLMQPMEAQMVAMTMMEEIQTQRLEAQYGDNKAQGVAFLDSIAKTEGVVKTESGLCYKVITKGKGAVPANTDKVKVHYRGTLIDGTEFDSSYSRNEPTTFRANQVIAGWTEALTMMPVGSKWMLYIPQELAYGTRDMGTIKPFSTLVFEVELLEIEK